MSCIIVHAAAPRCGDAVLDANEQCDDGNTNNLDGCSSTCALETRVAIANCGNGALDALEQCDDNNTMNGDGCSATCILEPGVLPRCGDRIINLGEECDDGNQINGDRCRNDCRNPIRCTSDAECLANETCTNGVCQPLPAGICGDGKLGEGEECDDSNTKDEDGCSGQCLLENGRCGDGVLQTLLDEQCEPSLHDRTLPYSCGNDCRFSSLYCGDSKVDSGEQCDKGNLNSDTLQDRCRQNCSLARCGDGVLDSAEQCDDDNRFPGDGCDRYCRKEGGVSGIATVIDLPLLPGQGASTPVVQQTQPPVGDTGPAAVAVMAAGAAAGYGWVRRRRRKKA